MKKVFILAVSAAAFLTSCKKDNEGKAGIFKGPSVEVHHGEAWTTVQLDNTGSPVRLSVSITDAALNSVPVGEEGEGGHDHDNMENSWTLKFHPKANITPFNHLGMGWNPSGHEPEIFYAKPHFDFHFYLPTPEEIAAIPPYEIAPEKFDNVPQADYLPVGYINPGGGVPQMGAHWIDPTSDEFTPVGFTQTFIYGTYDGKVNFYEPMITLDFLKNNSNFVRDIPQPAKVQKTGWYPKKLRVVKHDGLTDIVLDEFVYRTQS